MQQIQAAIDIAAPAERVWRLLTDFAAFPRWNPFIRQLRMRGELRPGTPLEVQLLLGKRVMKLTPTLSMVEPGQELRWQLRQVVPGLFDVERIFQIQPRTGGGVCFVQREECTGLLVAPILNLGMARDIRRGYDRFNLAMKAMAEEGPGS